MVLQAGDLKTTAQSVNVATHVDHPGNAALYHDLDGREVSKQGTSVPQTWPAISHVIGKQ
jgi:hypothetical protein